MVIKKEQTSNGHEAKSAFIITPIGVPNSPINREARGIIESAIVPVLKAKGFEVNNPMESTESGSIGKDIINKIVGCDLVIANLTGQNPNVMYELALRHSVNEPFVMVIRNDDISNLPFDIQDQRVVTYSDTLFGLDKLKKSLEDHIESAMTDEPNSPVYEATGRVTLKKGSSSSVSQEEILQNMMNKVDQISEKVTRLNSNNSISFSTKPDTFALPDLEKMMQDMPRESQIHVKYSNGQKAGSERYLGTSKELTDKD